MAASRSWQQCQLRRWQRRSAAGAAAPAAAAAAAGAGSPGTCSSSRSASARPPAGPADGSCQMCPTAKAGRLSQGAARARPPAGESVHAPGTGRTSARSTRTGRCRGRRPCPRARCSARPLLGLLQLQAASPPPPPPAGGNPPTHPLEPPLCLEACTPPPPGGARGAAGRGGGGGGGRAEENVRRARSAPPRGGRGSAAAARRGISPAMREASCTVVGSRARLVKFSLGVVWGPIHNQISQGG